MYSRTRALTLSLSRREKRKHSHFLTRNGGKTHSHYLTEGQAHSLSLSRTLKERLATSHLQIREHANFHLQTDTLSGEYTHSRTPAFTLRFSHRGSTAKLHSHTEGEGKLILIVSHRMEGTFIPTFSMKEWTMGAQLFTFSKNETARVPLFTFSMKGKRKQPNFTLFLS